MRRRVVISGMGLLSSAGANLTEAREKFISGTCCLREITEPHGAKLKARYAGLLEEFNPAALDLPAEIKSLDRHVLMAIAAAREALTSAKVRPAEFNRRMGLIFATCSGPMLLIEEHYERIVQGDPSLSADALFAQRYYAGARVLAHLLGVRGLSTTVVTACSASTAALGLAADLIRCGMLDSALAGGSDAFAISTQAGFDGLKAACEDKCAPFSKPLGLNLGEAAAFVFLETMESAGRRGVSSAGEIRGFGMSNDAYHCSTPEPGGRGLASAMKRALRDAGLEPAQIAYINMHGTGTEANDKAECKALRKIFGEQASRIPLSSTKSMVGHCLGAAGATEVMASTVCANAGVYPPTANFSGLREGCLVDCVPDAKRVWDSPRIFLSNNCAFGGHNASLVISSSVEPVNAVSNDSLIEPVYVTAIGAVSHLGLGRAALTDPLRNGPAEFSKISLPGLPVLSAGMVDDSGLERTERRLDLRNMDRSSRMATIAARLAIREAGCPEKPAALAELGLFLHLAAGPSWAESEYLTSFLSHGRQVTQLMAFPYIVPGSVAGNVCQALMLAGHNVTLSCGPGAGLMGLGPALSAFHGGHATALLSGAVDELSPRILTDYFQAGMLPDEQALPPGEGAVMLMLETKSHGQARGASPLAMICGAAFGTEAGHWQKADEEVSALEEVVRDALNQAGMEPDEVAVLCATGARQRLAKLVARMNPLWGQRTFGVAQHTGVMEGAQPLADLSAALNQAAPGAIILVAASSPHGMNGAVVFKKVDIFD